MDHPDRSDEQLMQAFLAGDTGALGELASRYERDLLGLALGLLHGRREAAMDAVQESWVRVIKYASSFRGNSTVKTWLYRITINRCRDLAAERNLVGTLEGADEVTTGGTASGVSDESSALLRRQIAALGPAKAMLLHLCYQRGMTHEQAALILDIPLGTLKSRLNAALAELRQSLPQECRP